jgi:hypothetical protein
MTGKIIATNPTVITNYQVYQQGKTLYTGDTLIFGAMVKALNASVGVGGLAAINGHFLSNTPVYIKSRGGFASNAGGPCDLDNMLTDSGWIPIYGYVNLQSGADSGTTADVAFSVWAYGGNQYLIWQPWMRILQASSGFTLSDAIKYGASIGAGTAAPAGVVAIQSYQTFLTGNDITANRPSASDVGAGAQFYDTTLSKPIWSNGSVWKDAAGNTV